MRCIAASTTATMADEASPAASDPPDGLRCWYMLIPNTVPRMAAP
jgi:hypothetical protein